MDNGFIMIFITAKDVAEAEMISQTLVKRKKAACVNIVRDVSSSFWWRGEIDSANETLLIVKTKTSLLEDLVNLVKSIHSYGVPEIIALPIVGGSPDYLKWLEQTI